MGNIIGIHTQTGTLMAYTVEPTQTDRAGGVMLLHDIWGLDDHTKSEADRLARQGYHVIVPNMLAGTAAEKQLHTELRNELYSMSTRQRAAAQGMLQRATTPLKSPQIASVAQIRAHAAFEYMLNQPAVRGRVSIMGFGFGGTHAINLAIRDNRQRSVVAYHPTGTYVAYELRHITCPILAFYGDRDAQAMASLVRIRPQMQAAQIDFTPVVYEHDEMFFFDETMAGAYNDLSARDAWSRAMSFFQKNMN